MMSCNLWLSLSGYPQLRLKSTLPMPKNKVIDKKEEDIKRILEKAPQIQGKQREFSQQMS